MSVLARIVLIACLVLLASRGLSLAQAPPISGPPLPLDGSTKGSTTAPIPMPITLRAPKPPGAPSVVRRSGRSGRVRLTFVLGKGSATCDSEALFRQVFASELDESDPFVLSGPAEAEVEVRLERDPPGFRGTVELRDMQGNVLEHEESVERTCTDAADRMMIALMLRVFRKPTEAPPPPAPLPKRTCEVCPEQPGNVEARLDAQDEKIEDLEARVRTLQKALDEEKRKMDLTFALSAGALMTANLTSNVGPGTWVEGDVRAGPLSLGLQARFVIPAPVYLGPYDFDVSQFVAALTPCGRYSVIFGCAVAGVGVEIHYDSDPQLRNATAAGPVLQIGGRLGVEVPFGDSPFGARGWGEVLYSAPRAGMVYHPGDGPTVPWWRPDVSAFFGLGLVLTFGKEETK